MPNTYDHGDEPRLTTTFTQSDVVADPTAVIIIVKKPDASIITYVSAGFNFQGTWNAATNTPSLIDGTGTAGYYYTVATAGTQTFGDESIAFVVGDWIYYNGKVWRRLKNVSAATITKVSTGVYYIDQYLSMPGRWHWGADGVGSRTASETFFYVEQGEL